MKIDTRRPAPHFAHGGRDERRGREDAAGGRRGAARRLQREGCRRPAGHLCGGCRAVHAARRVAREGTRADAVALPDAIRGAEPACPPAVADGPRQRRRRRRTASRATSPKDRARWRCSASTKSTRGASGGPRSSSDRRRFTHVRRRPERHNPRRDTMLNTPWEVVIGLETHTQLSTRSKIFSGASTAFGAEPERAYRAGRSRVAGRLAGAQSSRPSSARSASGWRSARPSRRCRSSRGRTTSTRICRRATRSARWSCRWCRAVP